MKPRDPDFEALLAAASEGRASDEEIDRLQQLLMADLDATDHYLDYVDTHANLADASVGAEVVPFPVSRRPQIWQFIGAIAALILVALFSWSLLQPEPKSTEQPNYIAIVTHAEGALWEGEDASVIIGSALTPGMIELCEGRVELELNSGVQVALEGQTRFRLVDAKHGVLEEGMLSANVPPEGLGFTVDTPQMEVVDLGTRFGLNVTKVASEVHVFDGEVEATLQRDTQRSQTELLTTSHTRRAQADNPELEAVAFDPERFVAPPISLDGVSRIQGGIRVLRTPPQSVRKGAYQHNFVLIFQEQAHIELEDPLEVSIFKPGCYQVGFAPENHGDFEKILSVGDIVDSYLLHYDTKTDQMTRCTGTVQFDRKIVAVIAGGKQLAATDELLGTWCTSYDRPGSIERQLENDNVVISADRTKLTIDWGVGPSADQIRVLVQTVD